MFYLFADFLKHSSDLTYYFLKFLSLLLVFIEEAENLDIQSVKKLWESLLCYQNRKYINEYFFLHFLAITGKDFLINFRNSITCISIYLCR